MDREFKRDQYGDYPEVLKIIEEYLAQKKRKGYYDIYLIEEDPDKFSEDFGNASHSRWLDDQQVAAFRQLIDKYGPKEYVNHWKENPILEECFGEEWETCKLLSINIANPHCYYRYTRHYLFPTGLAQASGSFTIRDENYINLLYYGITDGPLCFNYLSKQDSGLYDRLVYEINNNAYDIDDYDSEVFHTPFLVTLDEAEEDIKTIFSQNPDLQRRFDRSLWKLD